MNDKYWNKSTNANLEYDFTHSTRNKGRSGVHMFSKPDNALIAQWRGLQQVVNVQGSANTSVTLSAFMARENLPQEAHLGIHFRSKGNIVAQAWIDIPLGTITKQYQRYALTTKSGVEFDSVNLMIYVGYNKVANLYVTDIQFELANNASAYRESNEDIDERINSKADQKLTNQQLTALTEKAQLHDTELKAKATMEQLSNLEKAYEGRMKANEEAIKNRKLTSF